MVSSIRHGAGLLGGYLLEQTIINQEKQMQLINECIDLESVGITVHEAWEIMDNIRIDW